MPNTDLVSIAAAAITAGIISRHLLCARWYDGQPERLRDLRDMRAQLRASLEAR